MDKIERARRYIARIEAHQGQQGSLETFKACAALRRLELSLSEAEALIVEWNTTNAFPSWRHRELIQKLTSVYRRPFRISYFGNGHEVESDFGFRDSGNSPKSLWQDCHPVTSCRIATHIIRTRALDPEKIEMFNLARAAGPLLDVWQRRGFRLIVPVYNAAGEIASLKARAVSTGPVKELSLKGASLSQAALADGTALALLRGKPSILYDGRVIIVEGVPDFLTWSSEASDAADNLPAVFGVFSGAWSDAFSAAIPSGSTVFLRLHDDETGRAYTRRLIDSLSGRGLKIMIRNSDGLRKHD